MKILKHLAASAAPILVLAFSVTGLPADPRAEPQNPSVSANLGPTPEQIRSLVARAVENQHRNDRAAEEYEHVEHTVTLKDGDNSGIVSDRTERVFPSGTGTMRLQTAQSVPPVSPEVRRRQLQYTATALDLFLHPNDRVKQDLAKYEKRRHDRAELVDEAAKAFSITWVGRETRGSRTLAKLLLDPDPNYKPTSRFAAMFQHIHAVLWMDESQVQMVRLEGEIASDINFGGGVAGKIYHGGHFVMEQSEVAPGIWLPTLYTYDVDGRKFLFGFGVHERTEVSHYRHVGPPSQSIEIIRSELSNLSAESPTR